MLYILYSMKILSFLPLLLWNLLSIFLLLLKFFSNLPTRDD